MNNGIFAKYTGIPIIVVPDNKKQNRTHKKKRIIGSGLRDMDIQYLICSKMNKYIKWVEIFI